MSKLVKLGLCCIVLLGMVTTARAYEGYTPLTTGGTGGQIVYVTNLNNSGAGSLRAALEGLTGSPTTIRFSVSGTIYPTTTLWIIGSNATIAGETAPSPGITIDGSYCSGPTVGISGHDFIVQHIRVRNNGSDRETIQINSDYNLILDHLSVSGSADGAIDINNGVDHITVSNCLIAESVEGHRSYGQYASLHHNLYSYNNRRQPKIVNYAGPYDFRNNVIQYWTGTGTNVEAGHQVNIINNYFGPTEKVCSSGFNINSSLSADVYISGNYFTCGYDINGLGDKSTPNTEPSVTTMTADTNLANYVKSHCGAMPRDSFDQGHAGTAAPFNSAPEVDAGPDRSIVSPINSISLDGTVTDDGLPDPPAAVTTLWTKQSGPGTVTFGNANAVDTTATFSATGTYVLRLTADDDELNAYDEITITYYATAPSAGTLEWIGPNGTASPWETAANWYDLGSGAHRVPTDLDLARLYNALGGYGFTNSNVTISSSTAIAYKLQMRYLVTKLTILSGGKLTTTSSVEMYQGTSSQVDIEAGATMDACVKSNAATATFKLANDAATTGTDTVNVWGTLNVVSQNPTNGTSDLQICNVSGGTGTGTLNIYNTGVVNVDAYAIGSYGTGRIYITTGGTMKIAGNVTSQVNADISAGKIAGTYGATVSSSYNSGENKTYVTASGGSPPPAPPAWISYPSASDTGEYTVSWASSTGATSYQLQRSNNGGSSWSSDIYSGANTSYAEDIGNGSYLYRVKATNAGGSSIWRTGVESCVVTVPTWSETADYYVDGLTGSDSNPGTSSQPWATLTKAVSTATAGKKVLVWGGQTYVGRLTFSNTGTSASPITFRSDPSTGPQAVIDGNNIEGGAVYTTSADYIVLDNFKVTNATYGVYIYGNGADKWTIKNCTFTGNTGHGIYIRAGDDHSILNNIVYDNGSTFTGIYVYNGAVNCDVTQCSVYGHKYGIRYALSSSGDIKDSIVTSATTYGISSDSSTVTTTYSDVWDNGTNYYGCSAGTGCISADPLWVGPDNGDFTLGSGSPCKNTGSDGGDMGYRVPGSGPSNLAPVVNAGTDQQITLPASANLDGTVSDDGNPDPPSAVTTTWTKQSGPGDVTFGNASAVDTTASFSTSGTYVLRLTASDSALQTYDEVTITVNPEPVGREWSESADYYVDAQYGSDSYPGSSSQPWATLTKAVSTATSGKKVLVWGGQTYTAALTFNNSGTSASPITFKRDPASGTATINGNGSTAGTLYTTGADYIVIDGFTVTNGRYGAYIYGDAADGWTIKNCRITGNSYHGIYSRSGDDHLFFNNAIYGNGSSYYGIYAYSTALNNDVTQCDIYQHKYGIYYAAGCNAGNVLNSIITNATTYGIRGAATDVSVTYSDVWSNGTNYYGGVTAGTGCISANPLYTNPGAGDFHLQGGSPCDNTGSDGGDMGYRYSSSAL